MLHPTKGAIAMRSAFSVTAALTGLLSLAQVLMAVIDPLRFDLAINPTVAITIAVLGAFGWLAIFPEAVIAPYKGGYFASYVRDRMPFQVARVTSGVCSVLFLVCMFACGYVTSKVIETFYSLGGVNVILAVALYVFQLVFLLCAVYAYHRHLNSHSRNFEKKRGDKVTVTIVRM